MSPARDSDRTEVEAKLVVRPGRRAEIVPAFLALADLDAYALEARPARDIHDRYFDTAEGDLGRIDVALRLRVVDGRTVLTQKGPPAHVDGGALARFELEATWSGAALAAAADKLHEWGIELARPATAGPPEAILRSCGLRPVHDRRVRREVREAHLDGHPAAEIVVDAVRYEVGGRVVLHDEIEVEGRGPDGGSHVRTLVAALRGRFGDGLRPWRTSKLATGLALVALDRDGKLDGMVDPTGRLRPDAYEEIGRRAGSA